MHERLRSTETPKFIQPRVRIVVDSRSFSVAAPSIWNNLPHTVVTSTSVTVFKSRLKTHLFHIAFKQLSFLICSLKAGNRAPLFTMARFTSVITIIIIIVIVIISATYEHKSNMLVFNRLVTARSVTLTTSGNERKK